jgi:energy-coupling factor transport system permease protein
MNTTVTSCLFAAALALLLLLSGVYRKTVSAILVYAIFVFLEHTDQNIRSTSSLMVTSTLSFFMQKCVSLSMLGLFIAGTTTVTEIICALEAMKAPEYIIIPVAVAMRFFPSIQEDFSCLKDSLRVRNIRVSMGGFLRHPVQTIEYLLVPILIRSFKISDELAASAMLRGLDSGKPKTVLYPLKFGGRDFITFFIIMGFVIFLLCFQYRINQN